MSVESPLPSSQPESSGTAPERLALLRRSGRGAAALVLSALLVVSSAPSALAAPPDDPTRSTRSTAVPGNYIVTLADQPIASYAGEVPGLAATRPARGRKVDVGSRAADRYRDYLTRQQTVAAASVGATPTGRYAVALNGFTARLTPAQASRLQARPGVLSVTKDTIRKATAQTNNVDFLSLTGSNGVWAALGGEAKAGRGVVVGVIDSGVWPEAASFSGPALGTAAPTSSDPYRPYKVGSTIRMKKSDGSEFTGACQTGPGKDAVSCNIKLVGARFFGQEFLGAYPEVDETDYLSPRGADGHGTHTGSTAVGNAGVAASIGGHGLGTISGVAPAAKIAVYKALWQGPTEDTTGGATSDIIQAINAAVTDGVDVINYSVGTSGESEIIDPVQLAFYSAAAAGIFVSASAGNSGPDASTLDNTAPWVTTVGATTIGPRAATVKLGNGKSYAGISTTVYGNVGSAKLATGASVKRSAASTVDAAVCAPDTLDAAKTKARIVVCDRGVVDRVAKSAEVKRAGGVGMVLVNLSDNSQDGDTHSVPTVHLNPPASQAVKTYAASSGATATLVTGNQTTTRIAYPQVAGFSSRGPSLANGGDLLKPDLAAPGVAILAAFSPVAGAGAFAFESGTSMAAPQVAGLAALYLSRFPTMAPMSIKSALMTTAATTVTADGRAEKDLYAQGAGHVRPDRMFNPGVVFESGVTDWKAYLEGQGLIDDDIEAVDPSNLNSPSIAVGDLVGSQTVTRRVTAVKPGTYRIAAKVPGFATSVTPSFLRFRSVGETRTVTVRFTRTTAPYGQAAFGSLSLVGPGVTARIPIALTPAPVEAPDQVAGTGAAGSTTYTVRPGASGTFTAKAYGLAAAVKTQGVVGEDDSVDRTVVVPAGTKVARFSLTSDQAAADLDLAVYTLVGGVYTEIGRSGRPGSDETVTLNEPAPSTPQLKYVVTVEAYATAPGTTSTAFTLGSALVSSTLVGNLSVTPTSQTARAGQGIDLTVAWTGLSPSTPYVGWIEYAAGLGTVVTVN